MTLFALTIVACVIGKIRVDDKDKQRLADLKQKMRVNEERRRAESLY